MVVASFTEPAQQHRAPFPLIPTGVHIATMLAAAYPHFDIVDEKFVFRTSPETFADSLRYTTLGCVLLAAGHYACQFVAALRPLRHEYLGTMALLQLLYVGLLAGRAVLHPAAARADWAGSSVGALAALLSLVLTLYDRYDPRICPVAEAASEEELRDRLPSGSDAATLAAARSLAVRHAAARNAVRLTAAWLVPAATHALWLLYAVNLNLSYLAPYFTASPSSYGAAVQSALSYASVVPYREYVVLLVDGLAVLRLAAAVSGGGKKEAAAEAKEAKAGEAKSD